MSDPSAAVAQSPTVPAGAPPTFTPAMLAGLLGGEVIGAGGLVLNDIGGLERAGPQTLSFIRSPFYASKWAESRAGAALVSRGIDVPGHDPSRRALIVVPSADAAIVKLLEVAAARLPRHRQHVGVHASAIVDASAVVAPDASIGPMCVVGPRCRIGAGAVLESRVTLGADVVIGDGTTLFPGVTIYDRCTIGARCILNAGVVIGADGFGYFPEPSGRLVKIPHIGTVAIHDDVEIGANSCVDRGKFGATVIGEGTKIDNLVQIGHNVRVGRSCVICGQAGIAGSVTVGNGVMIGGAAGITDNIHVGDGARLAAMTGILADVGPGEAWMGFPAQPAGPGRRNFAALRHLAELAREVKRLARAVDDRRAEGGNR